MKLHKELNIQFCCILGLATITDICLRTLAYAVGNATEEKLRCARILNSGWCREADGLRQYWLSSCILGEVRSSIPHLGLLIYSALFWVLLPFWLLAEVIWLSRNKITDERAASFSSRSK